MLVDSHCHLDFPQFAEDLNKYVEEANDSGVNYFQMICTKSKDFYDIIKKASSIDGAFCSFGIHPCYVQEENLKIIHANIITSVLGHKNVIGIGETGLDYYHSIDHKELQKYSFIEHIKAAQTSGLPLIVHSRDAEDDIYQILKTQFEHKPFKILIHCFTGSADFAQKCLSLGSYISFSGIVTYKNASELKEIVKAVPLERILIETDAPYLAPTPHRGKLNQPAYVKYVAEEIAHIKQISFEEVANATTDNFFNLFSKATRL